MADGLVAVRCKLRRSTYEEERVFEIQKSDGSPYVGISPSHYCHDTDGHPLAVGEPPPERLIEGVVDARLVENGGPDAWVSLPTGETIKVAADLVRYRKLIREPEYVLVGP